MTPLLFLVPAIGAPVCPRPAPRSPPYELQASHCTSQTHSLAAGKSGPACRRRIVALIAVLSPGSPNTRQCGRSPRPEPRPGSRAAYSPGSGKRAIAQAPPFVRENAFFIPNDPSFFLMIMLTA